MRAANIEATTRGVPSLDTHSHHTAAGWCAHRTGTAAWPLGHSEHPTQTGPAPQSIQAYQLKSRAAEQHVQGNNFSLPMIATLAT